MQKEEAAGFSMRLTKIAARFEGREKSKTRSDPPGQFRFFHTVFRDLRELFTRNVTGGDLKDLVKRDARESCRFYMRNVDIESLQSLPRRRRYPAVAWKTFVALANRLTPPRRVAFILATFLAGLGWLQLFGFLARYSGDNRQSEVLWLILSLAIFLRGQANAGESRGAPRAFHEWRVGGVQSER
jgi:hypothetical protein